MSYNNSLHVNVIQHANIAQGERSDIFAKCFGLSPYTDILSMSHKYQNDVHDLCVAFKSWTSKT